MLLKGLKCPFILGVIDQGRCDTCNAYRKFAVRGGNESDVSTEITKVKVGICE